MSNEFAKNLDRFMDQEKLFGNEGGRGVENLCKVVRAIGYKDPLHFGQFAPNGAIGDLISFFEDNPGAVEAVQQWIYDEGDRVEEWNDALVKQLPEPEDEDSDESDG